MNWTHIKEEETYMWTIIFERYRIYLKKRKLGKRMERLKTKKSYWSNLIRYRKLNHQHYH